jgi:hypothetical protein
MSLRVRRFVVGAAVVLYGCGMCFAQDSSGKDSDVYLGLHANSHASAASIGLPAYPGATLYKDPGSKGDDSAADVGFAFGDFRFDVKAVSYVTKDSAAQVLDFYRKPLSHYGEVLECDHGKPVGKLTITDTGLTCSDAHGGNVQVEGHTNSSTDHELRAGSPHKYRIVGIDDSKAGSTHFGLVYLELPKDKDGKAQ